MARKEKGEEEEKLRKMRKKRRERKLSVEEPSNSEDERENGSTDLSVCSEEEEEVQCLRVSKSFLTCCYCSSNLSYISATYEGILLRASSRSAEQ